MKKLLISIVLFLFSSQIFAYDSGNQYCKDMKYQFVTCLPVHNQGSHVLYVTIQSVNIQNFNKQQLHNKNTIAVIQKNKFIPPATATILNKDGKTIFSDPISNNVGLICNQTDCKPWVK